MTPPGAHSSPSNDSKDSNETRAILDAEFKGIFFKRSLDVKKIKKSN